MARRNSNHIPSLIVCMLLTALFGFCTFYLLVPAANISDDALWWSLILTFFAGLAIFGIRAMILNEVDWHNYVSKWPLAITGIPLAGLIVIGIIFLLASMDLFHTNDYRNIMTVSDGGNFETAVPRIETAGDIPVVDRYTATMLGDRTMGTMEKYISQYEVSNEYTLIVYQGRYYRISPLEYGGLVKYWNNRSTGIPGYVLVDIFTQKATLVELPDNKRIFYAPSACFDQDMMRNLRNQHSSAVFGTAHFEIDEEGNPFYVIPTLESTASIFGAMKINGVCIMNATTGESKIYALNEVPAWVDKVYDVTYVMNAIAKHYSLVHGPFNFSDKDVRKTSYAFDTTQYFEVPNSNGGISIYTGVTSSGNDESNIGFILADVKTGEITYFANPGAEESSAQTSAQGQVRDLGYSAGGVMLVNIDGNETYFMTLKDAGLVKKYALVYKLDHNMVVVEDTVAETVAAYRKLFLVDSSTKGTVQDVYTVIVDGNTTYLFTLVGDEKLYASSIKNGYEQATDLTTGVEVEFIYSESEDENIVTTITVK